MAGLSLALSQWPGTVRRPCLTKRAPRKRRVSANAMGGKGAPGKGKKGWKALLPQVNESMSEGAFTKGKGGQPFHHGPILEVRLTHDGPVQ